MPRNSSGYQRAAVFRAAAQQRLNEVLPVTHLAVDGIYGPLTRGAVQEFQQRNGLAQTGSVDAEMWAAMFKAPVLILGQGGTAGAPAQSPATYREAPRPETLAAEIPTPAPFSPMRPEMLETIVTSRTVEDPDRA